MVHGLIASLPLAPISVVELLKSINPSVSQPNSPLFSASGAHDTGRGNDTESAEPTASGKYIGTIFVLSTMTYLHQPPATSNIGQFGQNLHLINVCLHVQQHQ